MTYGEWLEEEQERYEHNYYICSPRLYNVSEYTMLAEECRGGAGGKYIVKAPRTIINEFIKWLIYEKGCTIDTKTNKQILASWQEFLKTSIM